MKLTVALFVQNKSEQSGQPGQSNRVVRLQNIRTADSVDNSKLFVEGSQGSVSVDLSGVTEDIFKAFAGGANITVTLDSGA